MATTANCAPKSRAGLDLCGRHSVDDHGVAARHSAAAAEAWSGHGRPRTANAGIAHQAWRSRGLQSDLQARLAQDRMREGAAEPLPRALRGSVRAPWRRQRGDPRPQEWLLIEWPEGEPEPTKYWLATLPDEIRIRRWSISANCAGASSAIIRSSSRKLASGTSRVAVGEASTITPRCASPPTDS